MFLSKKTKAKPTKKRKNTGKRRSASSTSGKLYVANQIKRVTIPKSMFVGESDGEEVVKQEISVRTFVTDPAKVGAQWMWSAEEVNEMPDGKFESSWHGFRIYLEVPCYVERIVETQREIIEEVKREADQQYREWQRRSTIKTFGSEVTKSDLGLI